MKGYWVTRYFFFFRECLRRDKRLKTTIKIDPQQYSLHDTHKYPMKRILGAGGMGCVFLCGYRLKKNKRVTVKCFWENRKGSRDEIFHEPLLMAEIAGEWVPEPLDYGYFDNAQQARAFLSQNILTMRWMGKCG